MNAATTVKGAAAHGGPIILSAGIAMLAVALTAPGNARYPAQGAPPGPRPTVTVTATPAEQTPAPSPTPPRTVLAAEPARQRPAGGVAVQTAPRHDTNPSSARPSAAPSTVSPSAPPSRCQGTVLAAREPLGVLPRCAITIGGSR